MTEILNDYTKKVNEAAEELQSKPDTYEFKRGLPPHDKRWEELFEILDSKEFSTLDMLACVCAVLCRQPYQEFETTIMAGGYVFDINIKKKG